MAHKYRELQVWQRAMQLVTDIYALTRGFPREEIYGLTSQLRRAAVSVALNIAEGAGCSSPREFKRFVDIALRSLYETMTALEIAERLSYAAAADIQALMKESDQIAAMIVGLAKSLEQRPDYKNLRELDESYDITTDLDSPESSNE